LSIDECDTQLFGLSCVNKHSFHVSLGYPAQGHEADYRGKTVAGQNPAAITVDSVQCRTHARVLKLQQLARLSVRKRSENFVWQVVIPVCIRGIHDSLMDCFAKFRGNVLITRPI